MTAGSKISSAGTFKPPGLVGSLNPRLAKSVKNEYVIV